MTWEFIPNQVYDESRNRELAEGWLDAGRRRVADVWLENARQQAESLLIPFREAQTRGERPVEAPLWPEEPVPEEIREQPAWERGTLPGIGGFLGEQARGSLLGQTVAPYSDEEALARTEEMPGAAPFLEGLRKLAPEGDEGRQARMAVVASGLALGAGEPIRTPRAPRTAKPSVTLASLLEEEKPRQLSDLYKDAKRAGLIASEEEFRTLLLEQEAAGNIGLGVGTTSKGAKGARNLELSPGGRFSYAERVGKAPDTAAVSPAAVPPTAPGGGAGELPPGPPPAAEPPSVPLPSVPGARTVRPFGRLDLPEDLMAEFEDAAARYYKTKPTVSHAQTQTTAASIGINDEMMARVAARPDGEDAALLMAARANAARLQDEKLRLSKELQEGTVAPASFELAKADIEIKLAVLREAVKAADAGTEYARKMASEAGRTLNSLRIVVDVAAIERQAMSWGEAETMVGELTPEIAKVAREGKPLSKNGREKADALKELLKTAETMPEAAGAVPATAAKKPRVRKAPAETETAVAEKAVAEVDAETELWRRYIKLNREAAEARDVAETDRALQIDAERDTVMAELRQGLRAKLEKALEKEKKLPETAEEAENAMLDRMAAGIRAMWSKEIKEELLGWDKTKAVGSLADKMERQLLRDLDKAEQKAQVFLAKTSVAIEKELNRIYQEIEKEAAGAEFKAVRDNARDVVEDLRGKLRYGSVDRASPEAERARALVRELTTMGGAGWKLARDLADLLEKAEKGRAADIGREAAGAEFKAMRDNAREVVEGLRERLRYGSVDAASPEVERARALVQELTTMGGPGRKLARDLADLLEKAESGRAADIAREVGEMETRAVRTTVREQWQSLERFMKLAPGTAEYRAEANAALRGLRDMGTDARAEATRLRERANRARAKSLLGRDEKRLSPEEQVAREDELASQLARVDWTDSRAVGEFAAAMRKEGAWEKAHRWRLTSMLSGTGTMLLNTFAAAFETAAAPGLRVLAGTAERLRPVEAGARNATELMALDEVQGWPGSFPAARQEFMRTMETGIAGRPRADLRLYGKTGRFNLPLKLNQAADDFWYTLNFGSALRAEVRREAMRTGETMASIRLNLVRHPDVVDRAAELAARRTYTQDSGFITRTVARLRANPVGQSIIPFWNTIANMSAVAAERVGYGFVESRRLATEGDYARAADRSAEGLMGAGILATAGTLAAAGSLMAYGPRGERERRDWKEQGGQPYSVKVGDRWVSYANWGAFSLPLAMAASAVEASKAGVVERSITRALDVGIWAFGNFWVNMAALRGISDVVNAVTDPEQYGERAITGFATSWVAPGFFASIARAFDPEEKKPEDIWQAIAARYPVFSEKVPARMTQLGESKERAAGLTALLPVRISQERPEPVLKEYQRLRDLGFEVGIGKMPDTVQGLELTGVEREELQRDTGAAIRRAAERLLPSEGYRRARPEVQARILGQMEQQARERIAQRFWGNLLRRLPPDERRRRLQARGQERIFRGQSPGSVVPSAPTGPGR